MSKKSGLKISKKPEVSLQPDLKPLPGAENLQSPAVTTSVPLSSDFDKDIQKSKEEILAADSAPKTRGRKALPRDAQGNIIRTPSPVNNSLIPAILPEKEVAENKALLKEMIFPMLSGVAVKYALGDTRAALPEEQLEPMSQAGGEILTELFPGITSKYGKYGIFLGGFIYWGATVKSIRMENIEKVKKENEVKAGIPSERK